MKDATSKKIGCPFSTSRKWEKKMKHRTQKARRQAGKKMSKED